MRETALNTLIFDLEALILEAELHKRFNVQVLPIEVEKRMHIPNADFIKYQ